MLNLQAGPTAQARKLNWVARNESNLIPLIKEETYFFHMHVKCN